MAKDTAIPIRPSTCGQNNLDKIPQDLKALAQWVCHKDKIPYDPKTGRPAKTNDPKTWGAYEEAVKAAKKGNGRYDGIGFEFTKGDPFTCMDLDHCVEDGVILPWAQKIIDQINSYTEISPSGTGVHIYLRANKPGNKSRNKGVEIYEASRYLTVNGNHLSGTPKSIESRQKQLDKLYNDTFQPATKPPPLRLIHTARGNCGLSLSDQEIIKKAKDAKNGELFDRLMNGDTSDYSSKSEADLALCNLLAFWTENNHERIDSLFRQSGLFREKWDEVRGEQTYGDITISTAIEGTKETYKAKAKKAKLPGETIPNSGVEKEDEIYFCACSQQVGDARLFRKEYKDHFCFDHASGDWYEWRGNYWDLDRIESVLRATEKIIDIYSNEAQKCSMKALYATKIQDTDEKGKAEKQRKQYLKKISNLQKRLWQRDVLELASAGKDSLGIPGEEWDKEPWILGCKNGIINLKTGKFRAGKQSDYIKTVCPTEWKGINEPCPRWEKFLTEIFDGDQSLISFLQRLLGYSATGLTTEHILPIACGQGRNGKGTLFEILHYVLGPLSGPIQSELLLDQGRLRSSAAPVSDLMALRGKRTVWSSETDEGRKLNAGKAKWLTGGDTLCGRMPYGRREISFNPTHTLFVQTNHKPKIDPHDYALWQRIMLIPFNLSFVDNPRKPNERERDKNLPEKLKAEASGILAWLTRGCLEWQKKGLNPPKVVKEATANYQKAEDIIIQFLDECSVSNPDEPTTAPISAKDLYGRYTIWCGENNLKPMSGTKFGKHAKEIVNWKREEKGIVYYGLSLS
jgi:putative DNA primase/helicase